MEDRLIQIIKIGKGEIKDLVAASAELGVWRTRSRDGRRDPLLLQPVALSTLTIQLYEKEILAPTAIVVSEKRAHCGSKSMTSPKAQRPRGPRREDGWPHHAVRAQAAHGRAVASILCATSRRNIRILRAMR